MKLSTEQKEKIKKELLGVKVNYGYIGLYDYKYHLIDTLIVEDVYLKKQDNGKIKWTVKTNLNEISLYKLCSSITREAEYRVRSKNIKQLAKAYFRSVKYNDDSLKNYLETLDKDFDIVDVKIEEDEIEWLTKHVSRIEARFPSRYEKGFVRNFPNQKYTTDDRTWNYGFTMYFDSVDNIPQSLLIIKNKNGNKIDLEHKKMCNTSYIWKLVRDYSQFNFS
jgi:hypothetical protein